MEVSSLTRPDATREKLHHVPLCGILRRRASHFRKSNFSALLQPHAKPFEISTRARVFVQTTIFGSLNAYRDAIVSKYQ